MTSEIMTVDGPHVERPPVDPSPSGAQSAPSPVAARCRDLHAVGAIGRSLRRGERMSRTVDSGVRGTGR